MNGPYRSMLFVPGHHQSWVAKAVRASPDAIILDLEDAVAEQSKAEARQMVAQSIDLHANERVSPDFWVRPNGLDTVHAGFDLEAVVRSGLSGLVLPKLNDHDDVVRYDALTTHAEHVNGVEPGSTAFIASIETARGMANCEEVARASARVVSMIGATARDADTARSLGFRFSLRGDETLYLRSRTLLASRAAGHPFAVCGIWQDIHDLEGLRAFAHYQRDLGYDGQTLIHPSHVETIHQVYGSSDEELAFYQGMIDAFDAGALRGDGSVEYRGQHIDSAHANTARMILERGRRSSKPVD